MMRCALAAFAVALSAAATPLRAQPLEDVTMAVGGGFPFAAGYVADGLYTDAYVKSGGAYMRRIRSRS